MLDKFLNRQKPDKEAEKRAAEQVAAAQPSTIDLNTKVEVLQNMVIEQRQMIRGLLEVSTMLSEHVRYELILKKLTAIKNQLDKIK